MRVLVTGSSGQLGRELVETVLAMRNELGELPIVYRDAEVCAVGHSDLDISDADCVEAFFDSYGPFDIVFNCAAFTDVDGCETHEAVARRVNVDGPGNLAQCCAECNAIFVHLSTDYVFSGSEAGAREEHDTCVPLSAYGRTKLEGEQRALLLNPRTHIVRTAWLYGQYGANFVRTILRLGSEHEEISVVDDQLGNPTNAADLAFELLQIGVSDSFGIWHATCEGECSWADFAEAILSDARIDCIVQRCTSSEWREKHPDSASRPAFSSLENRHLKATIGNHMRPWRKALASFMRQESLRGEGEPK